MSLSSTARLLLILWVTTSCGGRTTVPPGTDGPFTQCTSHTQCTDPAKPACINNVCQPTASCTSNEQCDPPLICLASGSCGAAKECETNAQCCPPGAQSCDKVCVDDKCVGTICSTGQTDVCFIGCHEGLKTCVNGYWAECTAAKEGPEICGDNIDNDCNGITDDFDGVTQGECPECDYVANNPVVNNCDNQCGPGEQVCQANGKWSPCTAPTDCLCEPGQVQSKPCGKCGFEECHCNDEGVFECNLCSGQGFCEPGEKETSPCGKCGKKARTCTSDCNWSAFTACVDGGVCVPGTKEEQGCGNCGSQSHSCLDDCSWSVWTQCVEGDGCKQGEVQTKKCGQCGIQESVCGANCDWSPFGECKNMGACEVGEIETQPCGNCGTQKRTCNVSCQWGEFAACEGSGECSPGEVNKQPCGPQSDQGECKFGEELVTCNGSCQWNPPQSCSGAIFPKSEIPESLCGNGKDEDCSGSDFAFTDDYEPNNSCSQCYYLGEDPETVIYPTFDSENDKVDCFYFTGNDSGINPLESITIKVNNQPANFDVDIFLYKGQQACNDNDPLKKSYLVDGPDEKVSWGEGVLSGDDSDYYILIKSYGAHYCYKPYTLDVYGLK